MIRKENFLDRCAETFKIWLTLYQSGKKNSPANKIYRLPGHIFVFDKSQAVIPYVPEFIVYLPPVYKPGQYVTQVRNLN